MRHRVFSLAAAVLSLFVCGSSLAGLNDDVTITVARKKLDDSSRQVASDKQVTVQTQELAYKVTVTNSSFSTLPSVIIKYNVYYTETQPGETKTSIGTTAGSHTLTNLARNAPVEFDTDPFKLQSSQLAGGWRFADGASPNASDQTLGFWFKAFDSAGKQLGEYMNPSTLKRKVTWKDPQAAQ